MMLFPPGHFEFLVFLFCTVPIFLVVFGCMIVSPLIARQKGYTPYYWILALHPVGLIVIANLPPLRDAKTPEQHQQMEFGGNRTGKRLSFIGLLLAVPLLVLTFQSLSRFLESQPPGTGHVLHRRAWDNHGSWHGRNDTI